jgi:hypothetical protein
MLSGAFFAVLQANPEAKLAQIERAHKNLKSAVVTVSSSTKAPPITLQLEGGGVRMLRSDGMIIAAKNNRLQFYEPVLHQTTYQASEKTNSGDTLLTTIDRHRDASAVIISGSLQADFFSDLKRQNGWTISGNTLRAARGRYRSEITFNSSGLITKIVSAVNNSPVASFYYSYGGKTVPPIPSDARVKSGLETPPAFPPKMSKDDRAFLTASIATYARIRKIKVTQQLDAKTWTTQIDDKSLVEQAPGGSWTFKDKVLTATGPKGTIRESGAYNIAVSAVQKAGLKLSPLSVSLRSTSIPFLAHYELAKSIEVEGETTLQNRVCKVIKFASPANASRVYIDKTSKLIVMINSDAMSQGKVISSSRLKLSYSR